MMCENSFPMCFFDGRDLKRFIVLKFERCEHRDDISTADGDQEGMKC